MMSWNYRVVRCVEADGSTYYEIREAYYADSDATHPQSLTEQGARPGGETLLSLRRDVALMAAAFERPVLSDRDFAGTVAAVPLSDRLAPEAQG